MSADIESELTILCEEFLKVLDGLYCKGVINLSELNQMNKTKIEFLNYIRKREN